MRNEVKLGMPTALTEMAQIKKALMIDQSESAPTSFEVEGQDRTWYLVCS